jgi:hypothetical protein
MAGTTGHGNMLTVDLLINLPGHSGAGGLSDRANHHISLQHVNE